MTDCQTRGPRLAAALMVAALSAAFLFLGGVQAASAAPARHHRAPVNMAPPRLAGVARRGEKLHASPGSWRPAARAYRYQWRRSTKHGGGWKPIAGARHANYKLTKADEGVTVTVTVTALGAYGRASVQSGRVGPVTNSPPVNVSAPSISAGGTPRPGALINASSGVWTPARVMIAYSWQRSPDGKVWSAIARANARSYTASQADAGTFIRATVTASNVDGSQSAASAPLALAPVNTLAPAAPSGTPVSAATLSASTGSWNPASATLSYTWLRCPASASAATSSCSQVATGPTYTLSAADVSYRMAVSVTAASAAGSASATSALTGQIANALVTLGTPARAVPASFLGVSIETNELLSFEQKVPAFAALLSQLRVGDGHPLWLRAGGDSADETYLNGDGFTVPPKELGVDAAYFQTLGQLARSVPLKVMLDLNLAAHDPAMAAAVATEALKALPAGTLGALEIGNEPDLYHKQIGWNWNPANLTWGVNYGPATYASDFAAYAAALSQVAPGVPLAGGALGYLGQDWWNALLSADRSSVGLLTGHRYPLSACATPGTSSYPTIAGQLSDQASVGLATSVKSTVSLAHAAGLPFRVDELGSATCTGIKGVSDTFATALWAPDALFNLLAAGVDGVNVHTRFNTANTPLHGGGAPFVRPFFYGMMLFARTLGPGAALISTTVNGQLPTGVSVWPVRVQGNQMHVLLINKNSAAASITLQTGARYSAQVQALQASSMAAGATVTFAGQQLSDTGVWQGAHVSTTLNAQNGAYHITVPALNASLLTFTAS